MQTDAGGDQHAVGNPRLPPKAPTQGSHPRLPNTAASLGGSGLAEYLAPTGAALRFFVFFSPLKAFSANVPRCGTQSAAVGEGFLLDTGRGQWLECAGI